MKAGIYVHIPFCEKKCVYCAFASFVNNENIEKYFDALKYEILPFKEKKIEVDSIYFGGGTPSFVEEKYIRETLKTLRECFQVDKTSEITIECNPHSITKEKLHAYRKMGFNRISFGIQTFDEDGLKFLGRLHNSFQAHYAITLAKKEGFENINADLIIGYKGSTIDILKKDALTLAQLGIKHISTYLLQVEDNTPLKKMLEGNKNLLPSDEENAEIYKQLRLYLKSLGFYQYEVSNFALQGGQSKHNYKYWSGEAYLGFGLSASSYLNGVRFTNGASFEKYFSGEKEMLEVLTTQQKINEKIMLGLRCDSGVNLKELKILGHDIEKLSDYKQYKSKNIIIKKGDFIYLNPDYYAVNNSIIVSLMKM